jgi:hypothetical protein
MERHLIHRVRRVLSYGSQGQESTEAASTAHAPRWRSSELA